MEVRSPQITLERKAHVSLVTSGWQLFYNTYGCDNDDAGRTKGLGADYAGRLFNVEGIQVGTLILCSYLLFVLSSWPCDVGLGPGLQGHT